MEKKGEFLPVQKHRSLAPLGPLPKKGEKIKKFLEQKEDRRLSVTKGQTNRRGKIQLKWGGKNQLNGNTGKV